MLTAEDIEAQMAVLDRAEAALLRACCMFKIGRFPRNFILWTGQAMCFVSARFR